jgi:Protein of unknown function (DUF2911)
MRLSWCPLLLCIVAVGVVSIVQPQYAQGQTPAKKRVSLPAKASVTLTSGAITIDYCAPVADGREIFGAPSGDQKPLVPYGEVWRTGANAATTLKTSSALQIGDLNVPAGTYTIYSLPSADGWQLIVNKQTGQWGTVYDKAQDLGRVPMSATTTAVPVETFVIDFEKTTGQATELHLKWAGVDASVLITAVK